MSERADKDIYADFKLKKPLWSPWLMRMYFSAFRVKLNKQTIQHGNLTENRQHAYARTETTTINKFNFRVKLNKQTIQ